VNATEETGPAAGDALLFPDGLPGFPDLKRFVLIELREDGAFQELQSIDDPEVSMIVCVPWLFFPDYAPVLSDDEQEDLELETQADAVVFVPVTFDERLHQVSLNLLGPFVVNARTRRGRQLVLAESEYPVKAPISLPPS
jgi:flagellar assembly factor FliW